MAARRFPPPPPSSSSSFAPRRPARLSSHARLILALRDTPVIWADSLRHPQDALSLLARLPPTPIFRARVAPHSAPNSVAVLTYRARLQLAHNTLLLRGSPDAPEPIVGLLPLSGHRLSRVRPGVIALAGVLLEPDPRDFSAVAAALSRATSRPSPPALSRFEVLSSLGCGPRAKVYAVRDRVTGERLAMKVMPRPADPSGAAAWRDRIVNDRALLQRLRGHPFVLDLRHALVTDAVAVLVFEQCPPGDLFNLLRARCRPLDSHEAALLVAQLILALTYVHAAGGCVTAGPGRGLRPENILIDAQGWVRLAAFGQCSVLDPVLLEDACAFRTRSLAAKKSRRMTRKREERSSDAVDGRTGGGPEVMGGSLDGSDAAGEDANTTRGNERAGERAASVSPTSGLLDEPSHQQHGTGKQSGPENEQLSRDSDEKAISRQSAVSADMWSLGVLSHFVLTGNFPFQGDSMFDDLSSSTSDDEGMTDSSAQALGMSLAIENEAARDFVNRLLQQDASARLGCGPGGLAELRRHAWFAGVRWHELQRRLGAGALKLEKHKDMDLLDLGEQDIRQTFSTPVLPEGLSRRDSRRAKLSRLFSREAKEGESLLRTNSGFSGLEESDLMKGRAELMEKDSEGDENNDESLVFGFGFSSMGPAFSAAEVSRRKTSAEGSGVRGGRRSSPPGSPHGLQAAVAFYGLR